MARKFKTKLSEYNYYRKMINKNLDKLEKVSPDSVALERWRGYFQEITTAKPNARALSKLTKQARDLYKSGQTSIKVVRRSEALAIQTLHEEGYNYINRRNFNSFMRFLDDARAKGLGALYSSTQLIEAIQEAKQKGLTKAQIKKNIERWAKNVDRDKEGKIVEVVTPKKLKVRKYK